LSQKGIGKGDQIEENELLMPLYFKTDIQKREMM
jgi:hypothetical protein